MTTGGSIHHFEAWPGHGIYHLEPGAWVLTYENDDHEDTFKSGDGGAADETKVKACAWVGRGYGALHTRRTVVPGTRFVVASSKVRLLVFVPWKSRVVHFQVRQVAMLLLPFLGRVKYPDDVDPPPMTLTTGRTLHTTQMRAFVCRGALAVPGANPGRGTALESKWTPECEDLIPITAEAFPEPQRVVGLRVMAVGPDCAGTITISLFAARNATGGPGGDAADPDTMQFSKTEDAWDMVGAAATTRILDPGGPGVRVWFVSPNSSIMFTNEDHGLLKEPSMEEVVPEWCNVGLVRLHVLTADHKNVCVDVLCDVLCC
jgi:hypothetical protein